MTMADVLAVVVALIVIGVGFPALLVLVSLSFPRAVDRAQIHASARPVRAFAQGTLALVCLVTAASLLASVLAGLGKLLGALLLLGGLSVATVGAAGLARHLAAAYGRQTSSRLPLPDVLVGAALLELAAIVPLVGWFVVLPVTFLIVLGSGCAVLLRRPVRVAVEQPALAYQPQAE
jgi:hypothetical protein